MARSFTFGSYNTGAAGHDWTLTSWSLSAPAARTNLVTVPGRDGALDLSFLLTDGVPVYDTRELVVELETSAGTRADREAKITDIVNELSGRRLTILFPDDATHTMTGRFSVARKYNDDAHAAVTVTAICDPWKESTTEETEWLYCDTIQTDAMVVVNSRKAVRPIIDAVDGPVQITMGTKQWTCDGADLTFPDLIFQPGGNSLKVKSLGSFANMLGLRWRGAEL